MVSHPLAEPLESRRLLSGGPDLTVGIDFGTTGLPTHLVGGSNIDWALVVTNIGDQPAKGTMRMKTTLQIPNIPPFNFVAKAIPVDLAP